MLSSSPQDFESARLMFAMPSRRKVLRPRFPRWSVGEMKENASGGSRRAEVSGSSIERPSTERSSTRGVSLCDPSTFPKPGASEPDSTENGVPDLSKDTALSCQLPRIPRSHRGLPDNPAVR